jgi:hypothetical protein
MGADYRDLVLLLGSLIFAAGGVWVAYRQPVPFTILMALGAISWAAGNGLWLIGKPLYQVPVKRTHDRDSQSCGDLIQHGKHREVCHVGCDFASRGFHCLAATGVGEGVTVPRSNSATSGFGGNLRWPVAE